MVGNFNHTYHSTTNATNLPGIWTGIYLLGGNANIGNDTGNTIGTSTGTNNIEVNSTAAANVATYGIGINSTGSTVDINNNQVCGFTLNASSLTNGHSFIGIQNSAASVITIDNNTIGSASVENSIICTNPNESGDNEQIVKGIENTANATVNISNNTIANMANSCLEKGEVGGIFSTDGVNYISNNNISQLSSSSNHSMFRSTLNGISLSSSLEGQYIAKNTVFDLSNNCTADYTSIISSGIEFFNGRGTIAQNIVYDIYSATQFCLGYGLFLISGSADVMNNTIRLGYGYALQNPLAGILTASGSRILGNTVYITGTSTEGTYMFSTFAYCNNGSGTDEVENNNFVNNRTFDTHTINFAIGKRSSASLVSDHNNLYAIDPSVIAASSAYPPFQYPYPYYSFNEWQSFSGGDANSLSVDPQFVGAEDAIPDLHISASSPMINMGTSIYPLVVDIDDDIRDQLPDIGCDEFYTGSVMVGTGETYETLKAAFDAINAGTITGNISIHITSGTTETATATLYESGYNGTSNYTSVSIGTVTENIIVSGNIAAPIISFNGAHNMNMVNLAIENENSGGYCIEFTNSASNNRLAGCSLLGNTQLTNKGLITFGDAGTGSGNSNNIIENCNFSNKVSNYQYAVASIGTTGVGNNDNTITESNIYNFWSNGNSSAGIFLDENSSSWTITNNNLYQTETITATGGGNHYGIYALSSNSITISDNFIGGTAEECGGTAWIVNGAEPNTFTGISIGGDNTGESTVSGNTINNFSWTAAPIANMYEGIGVWTGIAYGGGVIEITGNTIGSSTVTENIAVETAAGYHVASYGIKGGIDGSNVTISDNTIGSIDVSTSNVDYSHIFSGIQNDGATEITISGNLIGSESTAKSINASTECTHTETGQHVAGIVNNANTTTCTIDNNVIKNLYNSTASDGSSYSGSPFGHTILGIAVTDGVNTVTSNTIQNLSSSAIDNSIEAVRGISLVSDKQGQEISNNTISELSSTSTLDKSKVVGIMYDGPLAGTNLISKNKIYKLLSAEFTGLASEIFGIYIYRDGIATTIENNMISLGTSETAGHYITGIYTPKNGAFYHNSVVIDGSVSGSLDASTYAFKISQGTSLAVVKNNVFVNTRTNSGTGKNYAVVCPGTNVIDYNAYWVDGTGTVLGHDGTTDRTELPIVTGQDANSVNAEITFSSTANGDLHTSTAAVNAAADPSVGVTTDFDGNTRNPLYPDMGADEFIQAIIIDSGANLDFGWSDVLTPTAPQSYQIVGIDLSNNMAVTAPEHFQVSLSSDEGFAQSISIPRTSSNVDATIYARFLPDHLPDVGYLHYGDITNSASGQEVTVNVQGSAHVIHPIVETKLPTNIATETATANAEITHTGGRNVINRGIIHWAYDGVDKVIGDVGVSNENEAGSFEAGAYAMPILGLGINTHYNYRSHANNGDYEHGGISYGETTDFWTFATIPTTPLTENIAGSTVDVEIAVDQNPSHTQYTIHETTTNRYIQADGSMNTNPVWQTKAEWGTATIALYDAQNRTGNRSYTFKVKARNGAEVETALGDATTILTLANTPNIMWVGNITQTSVDISVFTYSSDYSNNTAATLYAVLDNNSDLFVQADATLGITPAWKTRDGWSNFNITDLSIGTEYSFSSIAKNDDGIETNPGPEITTHTLAAVPGKPILTNTTHTTTEIEIDASTNPNNVEFAIYYIDKNRYVQPDGTLNYGAAWQTKAAWDGTIMQGLTPNTSFSVSVKARNGAGTETDASEQFTGITPAEVPPAPQLTVSPGATDLFSLWYIHLGSNPTSTELAFQDEVTGKYVQPDGTFADTPAWQTKASWEQTNVHAEVATRYNIRVKARNINEIETAFGQPSEVWTNPYAPGTTLSNITSNSVDAVIDTKGNPSTVEYAIRSINGNKWVQIDGTLGDESLWQTIGNWKNITITDLSPDTEYGVIAYARANAEQSAYNFDEQANARTHANIPGMPTFSDISQNSLKITVSANNNPTTVRYAIYETTTELYVDANGSWSTIPYWYNIQHTTSIPVAGLRAITKYTFKVKARNSDEVETNFGPQANVTTLDGPPTVPNLISPANASADNPSTLTFEWENISNAQNYSIQISESMYFPEMIFEGELLTSTSIEVTLPYNKTFYWRVRGTNEHGTGSWSQVWSFSTESGPPEAPNLFSPLNGDNTQPVKPFIFRWYTPDHTQGFTIQVSTQPDYSSFEVDSSYNLTNWNDLHYFYSEKIVHNTTYFWRVKAWNEHGDSPWSDEYTFTTTDQTPGVPILNLPENGVTNHSTGHAYFQWQPANLGEWSEFLVSTDSDFETLVVDERKYTQHTYILYDLTESTTYYWKVRSANDWAQSSWTDTWTFTTSGGTGVTTISENDITLYPNPATDIVKIDGINGQFRVEVISEIGVKLIDKKIINNTLKVTSLAPGNYLLKIVTPQGVVVKKLIIQ